MVRKQRAIAAFGAGFFFFGIFAMAATGHWISAALDVILVILLFTYAWRR